jgi:DNA repair protein RecO (recombination protein O)
MSIERTEGIVLSSRTFKETDKIISILCPANPRADFIVKGISSSKKRPITATEIGSWIMIDYYKKETDFPSYIKNIQIIQRYENLKKDYLGLTALSYILEIADVFSPHGENSPDIWKLLKGSLEEWDKNGFHFTLIPFFKLRILQLGGILPKDGECSRCHRSYQEVLGINFHLQGLEVVCIECLPSQFNQIHVLKIMEMMGKSKYSTIKNSVPFQKESLSIDQICNTIIKGFIGKRLRSEDSFYQAYSEFSA